MKKLLALFLAAALALAAFAGCSLTAQPGSSDPNSTPALSNIDEDAAVVTVGDEVVTMGEYMDLFTTYASYYVNYGYDIYSDEATLHEFQDFIIDLLAEEKIIAYQAKQAGFGELSEEKLKEVEEQVADELTYLLDSYRPQAEEEAASDPTIDVEERTKELVEAETAYYTGSSMTYAEFEEWIRDFYKESAVSEMFRESILSGLTVSDEALQAWYDETLASQQANYEANGGAYKDDAESYEKYGGTPVLYVPEGYSRVLHILIAPDAQPSQEYEDKLTQMDELASEYGELAFEAALSGEENARLDEIIAEYKTLEQAADALENARMAPAVATANQVYAKLEAGEDFATLMQEYTQDNSILSFESIAQKGLLISNQYESTVDWSKEVKAAFSALQLGQYSQIIQDEEGCHIIYYLSDETAGPAPLDSVRDVAEDIVLTELQDSEWASMLETWKNDGSVQINEELVRSFDGAVG